MKGYPRNETPRGAPSRRPVEDATPQRIPIHCSGLFGGAPSGAVFRGALFSDTASRDEVFRDAVFDGAVSSGAVFSGEVSSVAAFS